MRLVLVIKSLSHDEKTAIRAAVFTACEYFPNSHLGAYSRREDMRNGFKSIRRHIEAGNDAFQAASALSCDAYRYVDM